jgi:hypothetical protein
VLTYADVCWRMLTYEVQAALNVRGQCKCLDTPCTGISVALMQNGKTISTQVLSLLALLVQKYKY